MIWQADNFLTGFDDLRAFADAAVYEDVQNPADGVVYPKICKSIPGFIRDEVITEVGRVVPISVTNFIFLRMSPEGVSVPHRVHTDNAMGRYSLMLYLTSNKFCRGGTGFARHKEYGFDSAPATKSEVELAKMDQNDLDKWDLWHVCSMRQNRACIFDAELFHVALPSGGFGKEPKDARVVLTAFFD